MTPEFRQVRGAARPVLPRHAAIWAIQWLALAARLAALPCKPVTIAGLVPLQASVGAWIFILVLVW